MGDAKDIYEDVKKTGESIAGMMGLGVVIFIGIAVYSNYKSSPVANQAPAPTPTKWQTQANWRALERGQSMDQVRALLGEPTRVTNIHKTEWTYGEGLGEGEVSFNTDSTGAYLYGYGTLDSWKEPRWSDVK